MPSTPSPLLGTDHIDLLISAATTWHVLASPTTVAFSQYESGLVAATATAAGAQLRAENAAALQWLSDRGRTRLVDRANPEPYTFTEVARLVPVEVIKAAHAAEELCAGSPTWANSPARRLLTSIARAAAHRLEGYSTAPWVWTRPARRTGVAVAAGGTWRPDLEGVRWIAPEQLREHWEQASLILITTEVADCVPADLAARPGVFLLADTQPADEVWQAVTALDLPALVLFWPVCVPWLADQIRDPSPEYVEHRRGE